MVLLRAAFLLALSITASAQTWDYPARAAEWVSTESKFRPSFEWRDRYEHRLGVDAVLNRIRLGLAYTPRKWLVLSAMLQDTRAPGYGANAPATAREGTDLHEAYIELFPNYERGFGITAGRMMMNYGDGKLLGLSNWSNGSRTYDQARLFYRTPRARVDLLFVSPVKLRTGEFNRPVLGDHTTGVWTAFPNLYKKSLLEVYLFRHVQNRPGGFSGGSASDGTDRLGVSALGFRMTGPLFREARYAVEAVGEAGKVGPARLRAVGWTAMLSRRLSISDRPLDLSIDYKYASGTANPADQVRSGTLDQMYATHHDRFGHQDLIGWRNIHNARGLATLEVTKAFSLNLMYNDFWLACLKDGLYGASGKLLARSASSSAGRHAGREADLFATYRYHHFQIGAGYSRWFSGQFLTSCGTAIASSYVYVFHSYSF